MGDQSNSKQGVQSFLDMTHGLDFWYITIPNIILKGLKVQALFAHV